MNRIFRSAVLLTAVLFVMFIPASADAQMLPETVNEEALRTGDKSPVASDASGVGSMNRVAKWLDDAGTLGNSVLYESSGGYIGLGTTSPSGNLHIFGGATADVYAGMGPDLVYGPAMNFGYSGQSFGRGSGFFNVRPDSLATPPNPSLRFMTVNAERMIITNAGRIGIGTSNPGTAYLLDVNGATHVTGDLVVDGNIAAKYQDLAEWVPSGGDLAAGTVVVIHTGESNEVRASGRAYDTRVAGVVSPQPGIVLGVAGEGKSRVATMGRVRVKADARQAAIHAGDLLVTSATTGTAMKSQVTTIGGIELHRPGTILGKALEPLASGQGEILVLLSLQ